MSKVRLSNSDAARSRECQEPLRGWCIAVGKEGFLQTKKAIPRALTRESTTASSAVPKGLIVNCLAVPSSRHERERKGQLQRSVTWLRGSTSGFLKALTFPGSQLEKLMTQKRLQYPKVTKASLTILPGSPDTGWDGKGESSTSISSASTGWQVPSHSCFLGA